MGGASPSQRPKNVGSLGGAATFFLLMNFFVRHEFAPPPLYKLSGSAPERIQDFGFGATTTFFSFLNYFCTVHQPPHTGFTPFAGGTCPRRSPMTAGMHPLQKQL